MPFDDRRRWSSDPGLGWLPKTVASLRETDLVCAGRQAHAKALPGDLSYRTFQARLLMSWPQAEFDNDRWVLIYLRKLIPSSQTIPVGETFFQSCIRNGMRSKRQA